jgi:hypothetical protein
MKQKIRVFVETEDGNAMEYLPTNFPLPETQEECIHCYVDSGTDTKICVKCSKSISISSPKPIEGIEMFDYNIYMGWSFKPEDVIEWAKQITNAINSITPLKGKE